MHTMIARDNAAFARLGWSLILGLVASTLFTLFVIPVSYCLLRGSKV
jgi:multidrug efflux pump subunit AcrB